MKTMSSSTIGVAIDEIDPNVYTDIFIVGNDLIVTIKAHGIQQ